MFCSPNLPFTDIPCTCIRIYTYMYVHVYTCIRIYTYMYVHVYTCIRIYTYMYVHVYTCTCIDVQYIHMVWLPCIGVMQHTILCSNRGNHGTHIHVYVHNYYGHKRSSTSKSCSNVDLSCFVGLSRFC